LIFAFGGYCSAGILIEDKNWPPFVPILHHDIARDIPAHTQQLQYYAYGSWLGTVLRGSVIKQHFLVTILHFVAYRFAILLIILIS
jgi:hypothetical protein